MADDQLAQSKKQDEKAGRELTSHLTMWEGLTHTQGQPTQIIANRNLEPVVVYLKITSGTWDVWGGRMHPPQSGMVMLGTVPPCTRYEIPFSVLQTQVWPRFHLSSWKIAALAAAEPSGVLWQRLPSGQITGLTANDQRAIVAAGMRIYWPTPLGAKATKTQALAQCGSAD